MSICRQQRLLDLAGEQALAADLFQRAVVDHVAGDLDNHDFERRFGQVEGRHQAAAHFMRLPKRQRRAARANLKGLVGGREHICHAPA